MDIWSEKGPDVTARQPVPTIDEIWAPPASRISSSPSTATTPANCSTGDLVADYFAREIPGSTPVDVYHLRPTQGGREIGDEHRVSNYNDDREGFAPVHVIAIPGMRTDYAGHQDFLRDTATKSGRRIDLIANRTDGFARDLFNSAMGLLNYTLGRAVEPEAVTDTMNLIKHRLESDPNARVQLEVHSQGSIIASNALFALRDQVSAEEWQDMASRIDVECTGAACHVWPDGISVQSYAHTFDLVARATHWITSVKSWFTGDQVVAPTYISNRSSTGAHDSNGYVQDYDRFYVASFDNGADLADALFDSIRDGRRTDRVHNAILDTIVSESNSTSPHLLTPGQADAFHAQFLKRLAGENAIDQFQLKPETVAFLDQGPIHDTLWAANALPAYRRESIWQEHLAV